VRQLWTPVWNAWQQLIRSASVEVPTAPPGSTKINLVALPGRGSFCVSSLGRAEERYKIERAKGIPRSVTLYGSAPYETFNFPAV
jgi:hypothetical protein